MSPRNSRLSRRQFVQAAGAASLALSTPGILRAQKSAQVVVIGAGLSGLAAALLLQEAGLKVKVIEGRERVGGAVQR